MAEKRLDPFKQDPSLEGKLRKWAEKWIAHAMNTSPMTELERNRCQRSLVALYKAAKLAPPENIVFVASPIAVRLAAGFASYMWTQGFRWKPATRVTGLTRGVALAVWAATAGLPEKDAPWTPAQMERAKSGVLKLTPDWFECDLSKAILAYPSPPMWRATEDVGRLWRGNNQWAGPAAYTSFFRQVVGMKLPHAEAMQHYETLCELAGPMVVHEKFAIISDRPEVLKVDERNRPHSTTGPAGQWRDGSAIYQVHGVRVPSDLLTHPKSITPKRIAAERNAEVRRVMIELYGVERYVKDSKAEKVHTDDWGTLWRMSHPGDEPPLMVVQVANSTPEPDGTFKDYFLMVHPELRPLLSDEGGLGEPQALTARNAVASTFGLRGEQYKPEMQT